MNPIILERADEEFRRIIALRDVDRDDAVIAIDDESVRGEVVALLAFHRTGSAFLDAAADPERLLVAGAAEWTGLRPGDRVGRFVVEKQIGTGGMAAVYEATQDDPQRRVALKVMHGGGIAAASATGPALWRFRAEARILARLDHPSIAKVHEAGVHLGDDGLLIPYFAMELIEGARDVLEYAREQGIGLDAKLLLMVRVIEAVHYGHTRGVVHRDLKPSNLLVDRDGRPVVIDFGVARASDLDVTRTILATRRGEFLGSPRYMSPEQCLGDPDALDIRTDVYSLGLVLYELLTERFPYDLEGNSWLRLVDVIRETAPLPPGRVDRQLAGDLETVILKALAKDPDQRYASAAQFADDLRRYLRDEPIVARPASLRYRVGKWVRRHRVVAVLTAVAAVSVVWALAAMAWGLRRERASSIELRDEVNAKERARSDAAEAAERVGLINGFLERVLRSPDPSHAGRDVLMSEALRRAIDDIDTVFVAHPGAGAEVRLIAAETFAGIGEMTLARAEGERAVAALAEVHGRVSDEYIDGLNRSARIAITEKAHARARELLVDAYEISQTLFGASHRKTIAIGSNLASVTATSGDATAARALIERLRAALPAGDVETDIVFRSQSVLLAQHQRDFVTAEREGRVLLDDARAALGPTERRTLLIAYNLASVLVAQAKLDEAEALLPTTLAAQSKLLGPTHPETTLTSSLLGLVFKRAGSTEKAIEHFASQLQLMRDAGLERSYDALFARVRLLDMRLPTLGAPEAITESLAIVSAAEAAYPDSPVLSDSRAQFGLILRGTGRYIEAEMVRRADAESCARFLGPDNPITVVRRLYWYAALCRVGRYEEAEELARAEFEAARTKIGTSGDVWLDIEEAYERVNRESKKGRSEPRSNR